MSSVDCLKVRIKIGDKYFVDVTNETHAGQSYSYSEAKEWGENNKQVACSN